jgi:hypothetical protein
VCVCVLYVRASAAAADQSENENRVQFLEWFHTVILRQSSAKTSTFTEVWYSAPVCCAPAPYYILLLRWCIAAARANGPSISVGECCNVCAGTIPIPLAFYFSARTYGQTNGKINSHGSYFCLFIPLPIEAVTMTNVSQIYYIYCFFVPTRHQKPCP